MVGWPMPSLFLVAIRCHFLQSIPLPVCHFKLSRQTSCLGPTNYVHHRFNTLVHDSLRASSLSLYATFLIVPILWLASKFDRTDATSTRTNFIVIHQHKLFEKIKRIEFTTTWDFLLHITWSVVAVGRFARRSPTTLLSLRNHWSRYFHISWPLTNGHCIGDGFCCFFHSTSEIPVSKNHFLFLQCHCSHDVP